MIPSQMNWPIGMPVGIRRTLAASRSEHSDPNEMQQPNAHNTNSLSYENARGPLIQDKIVRPVNGSDAVESVVSAR